MFTGIIEEIGKISNVANIGNGKRIRISVKNLAEGLKEGDSVSVNGACLTVVKSGKDFFEVDVVEETLRRTNLGNLTYGSHVNLEKARKFVDRLDGHIVQGHIDTTGKIEKIQPVQLS
ncbi:MAG: riboflavin synthase, partial [Candidatus Kapaibacteriota bacterium]